MVWPYDSAWLLGSEHQRYMQTPRMNQKEAADCLLSTDWNYDAMAGTGAPFELMREDVGWK